MDQIKDILKKSRLWNTNYIIFWSGVLSNWNDRLCEGYLNAITVWPKNNHPQLCIKMESLNQKLKIINQYMKWKKNTWTLRGYYPRKWANKKKEPYKTSLTLKLQDSSW